MLGNKIVVSVDDVTNVSIQALVSAGVALDDARIQVELLLEAELKGLPSHGVQRLPRIVERIHNGVTDPAARGISQWRGAALLDVDGGAGLGPVVALEALDQIRVRARETGIAAACIRNNNHLGMLAFYAQRVAAQGQVLIALSTSEALVHPWGGRRAMLGTNPISIGVPAIPAPFVFDMATSLVSMGEVHAYAYRGDSLPEGWALDADGNATIDAEAAKAGAIAPFGGAKGYALGLAFEVLVASLTASALGTDVRGTLDNDQTCNKGDVFIVAEPAGGVAASVTAYLDAIRACPPIDPLKPVMVPGDRAAERRARSLREGVLLPEEIWSRLSELAGSGRSPTA